MWLKGWHQKFAVLTGVLVFAWANEVFGQATPEERAQTLAAEGVELFRQGLYKEALLKFLDSYAYNPIPEVVWNIARCYEELKDFEKAIKYFEEFEKIAPDEKKRRRAKAKIEKIRLLASSGKEEKTGSLEVLAEGAKVSRVRVVVDGVLRYEGKVPARVEIPEGRHEVEVTGDGDVIPFAGEVEVEPSGRKVVVLRPKVTTPEPLPRKTPRPYPDPFLFPSARTGNAVGIEISPAFSRGRPPEVPLPTQSFGGIFVQVGGEDVGITLRAGRASQVPPWLMFPDEAIRSWNLYEPWQHAGLELKRPTKNSREAWNTVIFDFDYRHLKYEWVAEMKFFRTDLYSIHLMVGDVFGVLIGNLVTFEFFLGVAYVVPAVDQSWGWRKMAVLAFPMAGRLGVMLPFGHFDVEARWPLSIGPLDPWDEEVSRGAGVYADLAVGYKHFLGPFEVGGAIYFALNRRNDFGREKVGLILESQYKF